MRRVRTCAWAVAAVSAFGLVDAGATARGGAPDSDPARAEAVEAIERAGGIVTPGFLFFPQGWTVILGGSQINDEVLAHLGGLKGLSVLLIDDASITDDGLAHLEGLDHLKVLCIESARVTDDGLAHLGRLKSLREMDLKGTQITDAGLDHLKGLKRLRKLYVGKTRVTAEGIEKLRQSLPWCRILRSGPRTLSPKPSHPAPAPTPPDPRNGPRF